MHYTRVLTATSIPRCSIIYGVYIQSTHYPRALKILVSVSLLVRTYEASNRATHVQCTFVVRYLEPQKI
jgi:hypothetical protein